MCSRTLPKTAAAWCARAVARTNRNQLLKFPKFAVTGEGNSTKVVGATNSHGWFFSSSRASGTEAGIEGQSFTDLYKKDGP